MPIDETLTRSLLTRHLPAAAALPIAALPGGWDNRSFRVGARLVARLPSDDRYIASAVKEAAVLPLLAGRLPVAVPRLVAAFGPDALFARPWSIMEWIEGETAGGLTGDALVTLAGDLTGFLRALQALDPGIGPAPGEHSFGRGGPLIAYDEEMRWALARLGTWRASTMAVWERALAVPFAGPAVWLHGDLHPGNLLMRDGRLAAVIDWGLAAVGDPAADLAAAWRWMDADARAVFRAGVPADEGAWARGAGWAVWKAAIILAGLPGTDQRERGWAAGVLDGLAANLDVSG